MSDAGTPPTRRSVLAVAAGSCACLGALGPLVAWGAGLVPRVHYEPPLRRKVGKPSDVAEGLSFRADLGVFLVRKETAYRALSAVCTHLGCTVSQEGEELVNVSIVDPISMLGVVKHPDLESVAQEARAKLERVAASLQNN
mgnify:CR=1 FL=1